MGLDFSKLRQPIENHIWYDLSKPCSCLTDHSNMNSKSADKKRLRLDRGRKRFTWIFSIAKMSAGNLIKGWAYVWANKLREFHIHNSKHLLAFKWQRIFSCGHLAKNISIATDFVHSQYINYEYFLNFGSICT